MVAGLRDDDPQIRPKLRSKLSDHIIPQVYFRVVENCRENISFTFLRSETRSDMTPLVGCEHH